MLSDRCLPVCLSCLSVTFVHCNQTVGRIKMKVGTQVGLGPGHTVLDGDPAPRFPKGHSRAPQFSAHICCGQMAAWIKMSLGTELCLGSGDFVLDGGPRSPFPKRPAILGPCLLWPNRWMDEAGSWHGGRPQPRRLCVRWGHSPSPKRGRSPLPNFRLISIVAKRLVWR